METIGSYPKRSNSKTIEPSSFTRIRFTKLLRSACLCSGVSTPVFASSPMAHRISSLLNFFEPMVSSPNSASNLSLSASKARRADLVEGVLIPSVMASTRLAIFLSTASFLFLIDRISGASFFWVAKMQSASFAESSSSAIRPSISEQVRSSSCSFLIGLASHL